MPLRLVTSAFIKDFINHKAYEQLVFKCTVNWLSSFDTNINGVPLIETMTTNVQ